MKHILLTILACALFSSTMSAQIVVDFEGAELSGKGFMAGGFEWKLTGDFLISEFDDFSCDGTVGVNRYMDSGYLDSPSEGSVGGVAPLNEAVTFRMSTNVSQCVWVGSGDGEFISTGTIKVTGVLPDSSTVEESFELSSLNFTDMLSVSLSTSVWDGVDLSSLQVEITSTQDSTDYVAIDNLAFAEITTPNAVQSVESAGIELFPNPTSGILFLENVVADQLVVYDALGQIILDQSFTRNQVDLSTLPKGVYLIKIREGDHYFSGRVIRQ